MTPVYHFHLFHTHLDIRQVITAENSPLHIARSQTQIKLEGTELYAQTFANRSHISLITRHKDTLKQKLGILIHLQDQY